MNENYSRKKRFPYISHMLCPHFTASTRSMQHPPEVNMRSPEATGSQRCIAPGVKHSPYQSTLNAITHGISYAIDCTLCTQHALCTWVNTYHSSGLGVYKLSSQFWTPHIDPFTEHRKYLEVCGFQFNIMATVLIYCNSSWKLKRMSFLITFVHFYAFFQE